MLDVVQFIVGRQKENTWCWDVGHLQLVFSLIDRVNLIHSAVWILLTRINSEMFVQTEARVSMT